MYTVSERELAVLLQFGEPVASRTQPGLYFKLPMVQEVMRLPKTLQVWHGTTQDEKLVDVPTADGKKVEVTVWAVWRITDPVQFVRTLRTVPNAESRVKEFVRSTARDTITTHNLAEIVRSTNRKMTYTLGLPPEMIAQAGEPERKGGRRRARPGHARLHRAPEAKESVSLGRLKITRPDPRERPASPRPGWAGPGREPGPRHRAGRRRPVADRVRAPGAARPPSTAPSR